MKRNAISVDEVAPKRVKVNDVDTNDTMPPWTQKQQNMRDITTELNIVESWLAWDSIFHQNPFTYSFEEHVLFLRYLSRQEELMSARYSHLIFRNFYYEIPPRLPRNALITDGRT